MAGCSLAGGLGTSLVRLELLVLGMGGDPLRKRSTGIMSEGGATKVKGREASSPGLVDVCALAGGTSGGRLGQRSRVQDPLWPSVDGRLLANRTDYINYIYIIIIDSIFTMTYVCNRERNPLAGCCLLPGN